MLLASQKLGCKMSDLGLEEGLGHQTGSQESEKEIYTWILQGNETWNVESYLEYVGYDGAVVA